MTLNSGIEHLGELHDITLSPSPEELMMVSSILTFPKTIPAEVSSIVATIGQLFISLKLSCGTYQVIL